MKRYEDIDSVRLFELWRSGDRAAGEALVRRHQGSVEGFLRARTASAAEELTQQTMWALLQGGYRGQASVRTFLFAVARNKLRYYIHTQGVSRGRVAASEEVIEDRDPTVSQLLLGQERRERLLVGLRSLRPDFQLALALLALETDHVGNIGLQDDGTAIVGALFADLQPAVADQRDVEDDMLVTVAKQASVHPISGRFTAGKEQVDAAADQRNVVIEGDAWPQRLLYIRELPREPAVAKHQSAIGVEQCKPFLDGLDRVCEVAPGPFGLSVGLGQTLIGFVEQIERLFQIPGAGTDLLFKEHGALEMRVAGAAVVARLLDASHQRLGNLPKLVTLALERFVRINERIRHCPLSSSADRSPLR